MMTEYQKQKLDELIHLLATGLTWLPSDEDYFKKTLRLAKEIRDRPHIISHKGAETSADSYIMDAYFQGKRLELFQSIDGTPFVGTGDDVYACTCMILDRFVGLLAMRQAHEEMTNEEAI